MGAHIGPLGSSADARAVGDHFIVEMAHGSAAGLYEQERENSMQSAGGTRGNHTGAEHAGRPKMLGIGFADGAWMFGEEFYKSHDDTSCREVLRKTEAVSRSIRREQMSGIADGEDDGGRERGEPNRHVE